MKLDLGSLMFNMNSNTEGGTPSWGTAISYQDETHKYKAGTENIITGLLFNEIKDYDIKEIGNLGRGGQQYDNNRLIVAGLFKKIYVNNKKVNNAKFVLAIIEQTKAGTSGQQHIGRKTLKYKRDSKYENQKINEECYKKIGNQIGVKESGSWFITDIDVVNQDELHFKAYVADKDSPVIFSDKNERKKFCIDLVNSIDNKEKNEIKQNVIYYGIPGSGKSYYVENELLKHVDKEHNVFRTTFYLDYSNSDFIGQLMPVTEDGNVKYKNIPGPFTLALERALSTDDMVYLVIEEINRGNAAAIFGDIFQLLDRRKEDGEGYLKGDSEYPITNEFIDSYLSEKDDSGHEKGSKIYIPHNLIIYATMNTSDQNVFPLDTAFQRRWDRVFFEGNWDDVDNWENKYIPYFGITWRQFAATINDYILENNDSDMFVSQDKLFGPYFISQDCLVNRNIVDNDYVLEYEDQKKADPTCEEKYRTFVNNVIDYLYNDVTKFNHDLLFCSDNNKTFSKVYDTMLENKQEYITKVINENENHKKFLELMDNVFTPEVLSKLKGNNEQ